VAGRQHYPQLGLATILQRGDKWWIEFDEWDSELGFEQQPDGKKVIRLLCGSGCEVYWSLRVIRRGSK